MSSSTLNEKIMEALTPFVGLPLTDIWRAPDSTIQVFEFGPQLLFINDDGKEITRAPFALHVSCAWRIIDGSTLVVGSDDFEFDEDETENKLDVLTEGFGKIAEEQPMQVEAIECDAIGGIALALTGNRRVEIVPCETGDIEWWRIAPLDSAQNHFVVTGEGIYSDQFEAR